jgi:biotin-(acetyl-CoA carboxylase) ligase
MQASNSHERRTLLQLRLFFGLCVFAAEVSECNCEDPLKHCNEILLRVSPATGSKKNLYQRKLAGILCFEKIRNRSDLGN